MGQINLQEQTIISVCNHLWNKYQNGAMDTFKFGGKCTDKEVFIKAIEPIVRAAGNKEQPANCKLPLQPGKHQQLKDSIPLLKSAMDSLSRRCDEDESTGALYNISAVIAVLESI